MVIKPTFYQQRRRVQIRQAMDRIKHLYWRAGFGLSPEEWSVRQNWDTQKAVNQLFAEAKKAKPLPGAPPVDIEGRENMTQADIVALRKEQRKLVAFQSADWLHRMADPAQSALLERVTLFWHGHFACQTKASSLATMQANTLRTHALGSFRELTLSMARDVSMIRFLNNQQNKKNSPNENFARELMELFTIGRGNYTETDVKEAARAFTGWSSNLRNEFIFRPGQHDYGAKVFMGKRGNFDGGDIIDQLLEKRATADFIARKAYRYFVNEQVDEGIVKTLSKQFYESDYNIEKLLRSIFESDWFYAPQHIGTKIKSPIELMAGILRKLNIEFESDLSLIFVQRALGQVLFNPPNVAGWPGGRSWIDNSTLTLRLSLAGHLLNSSEVNLRTKGEPEDQDREKSTKKLLAKVDTSAITKLLNGVGDAEIADVLANFLLQAKPKGFNDLLAEPLRNAPNREARIRTATMALMSLPEYQMC